MKRRAKDFVSLFNAFWYRDFPITPDRIDISRRALWTTHIASTVKLAADHLGLYTCFESGQRNDAVIQDSQSRAWSKIEWEWDQAKKESVNEIDKLAKAATEETEDAEAFFFIGYSRTDNEAHQQNIESITTQWGNIEKPLIVFLVTYSYAKDRRHFQELQTHIFEKGRHKLIRIQDALPWQVQGTKWQASTMGSAAD